jgi:hypothetical protein
VGFDLAEDDPALLAFDKAIFLDMSAHGADHGVASAGVFLEYILLSPDVAESIEMKIGCLCMFNPSIYFGTEVNLYEP